MRGKALENIRMKVVFRVDASTQIGSGHVMRCLCIADELKKSSAEIYFVCRELPGNLCFYIERKGYTVYRLTWNGDVAQDSVFPNSPYHIRWLGASQEKDALETSAAFQKDGSGCDWMIVDHYAIDYRWERMVRSFARKIMCIDDLADRRHDCDLLLDQNLYQNPGNRYEGLVSDNCKILIGPRYALLREEFHDIRCQLKRRTSHVQRILVFFGGMDLTNETAKALSAIEALGITNIAVDVIVGSSNPHKREIKAFCLTRPAYNFYCQVDNMAELMGEADLSIGGGGVSTWERCCLMLPAIVISLAFNQVQIAREAAEAGAVYYLGCSEDVTIEIIAQAIEKLLTVEPYKLKKMIASAETLVDGKGVIRVARQLGLL